MFLFLSSKTSICYSFLTENVQGNCLKKTLNKKGWLSSIPLYGGYATNDATTVEMLHPFFSGLFSLSLQKNQEGMDLKPVSRNRRRSICFLRPFFLFLGLEKVEQLAIDSVSVKFVLNKHLKRVSTSFILKIDEFLAKSKRCPLQLGIVIFPSPILS